jgi:hypothetical protein
LQASKLRGTIWAARLGLLALALNSLVPIHIAFDLAEALGAAHHRTADTHAEVGSVERHLLALLTGHGEADHEHGEHGKHHHGTACPVCSALGALAGFTPPVQVVVAAPVLVGLPTTLPAIEGEPLGIFAAAYRSRAPPAA